MFGAFNRLVIGVGTDEGAESDDSIECPTVIERNPPKFPTVKGKFAIHSPDKPREPYRVSDSYELLERTVKVRIKQKKTRSLK
jgi:hypothetical protein